MSILVPLAEGFEEIEAITVIDVLRRGGIDVCSVAIGKSLNVLGSRGITVTADKIWDDIDWKSFDGIVLPGGGDGTKNLAGDPRIAEAVRVFDKAGKLVAAICAAPMVLGFAGILKGRKATCYPSCEGPLGNAYVTDQKVVEDGNLITSQGPGTAMDFALALVRKLAGEQTAKAVCNGLRPNW